MLHLRDKLQKICVFLMLGLLLPGSSRSPDEGKGAAGEAARQVLNLCILIIFQPPPLVHPTLISDYISTNSHFQGTRALTRAATASAPPWQVGKKSGVEGRRTLRAAAQQARCLKESYPMAPQKCAYKASSSILSTSELVASSASLASMDPSQQEDYVASLRCFLSSFPFSSHTTPLIPILLPGEYLPIPILKPPSCSGTL